MQIFNNRFIKTYDVQWKINFSIKFISIIFLFFLVLPVQAQEATRKDLSDGKKISDFSDKQSKTQDKTDEEKRIRDIEKRSRFVLGDVLLITGERVDETNTVVKENFQNRHVQEISRALEPLSGVHVSQEGGRNEPELFVRGFDLRQVPIFLDGVPIYIPYDGQIDLTRFTTFNLSEIRVDKGFSSVLYGPNTMGGAINLITSRPAALIDFSGTSGVLSGNGYYTSANIGSRMDKFYVQGHFSRFARDFINLSRDFSPTSREDGDRRENSYSQDQKGELRLAYTPNSTDEYAISYSNQQGKKGIPVSLDPNDKPRYWEMPVWDKESVYFISHTQWAKQLLKTRFYYDAFDNTVKSYDDATLTSQTNNSSFTSIYNDYTFGGSMEWNNEFIESNLFKLAFHYKQDVHRSYNIGEPEAMTKDHTMSIGAENIYSLGNTFDFIIGSSFNYLRNLLAELYNKNLPPSYIENFDADSWRTVNALTGIIVKLNETKIKFFAERKTRFANMKDRYSYRLGKSEPNPNLLPETSVNLDLSVSHIRKKMWDMKISGFYSHLTDTMQEVYLTPSVYQWQNTGRARFYGVESNLKLIPLSFLSFGVNYTWMKRKNLTNEDIQFTGVPEHSVYAFLEISYRKDYLLLLSSKYDSERYAKSTGEKISSFVLFNADMKIKIMNYLSITAGLHNILDRNYEGDLGYPEQGRNFVISAVYQWQYFGQYFGK